LHASNVISRLAWPTSVFGLPRRKSHRAAEAQSLGCDDVVVWCAAAAGIPHPMKGDHDKLDAVMCLLVTIRWRPRPRTDSVMLGDLETGYMVIPASAYVRAYLMKAARLKGMPMYGSVPV
jgi:predicted RNase H-like nuclease